MMTFQERSEQFQKEIESLQKKYGVQLYAANALLQNGEFVTLLKLRDLLPQEEVVDLKKYDNNSKKRNPASEKIQEGTNKS